MRERRRLERGQRHCKRINMRATITILLIALLPFTACNQSTSGGEIDVKTFESGIEQGEDVQVLDVRTDREVAHGVLKDAVIIDYFSKEFESAVQEDLDKNAPVYIYCASGNRSGQAMKKLQDMGFSEVYSLKGGITAWKEAGQEVVMPIDK